jgi:hypothetical protein
VRPGTQPEVPVVCRQCRLQGVRPAELLKLRRDLGVIQVWMVAATRADELKRVGVAAFHPALDDTDRLAPDARRPAMAGLASKRERHRDALRTDAQPRVTCCIQASRHGGGT